MTTLVYEDVDGIKLINELDELFSVSPNPSLGNFQLYAVDNVRKKIDCKIFCFSY